MFCFGVQRYVDVCNLYNPYLLFLESILKVAWIKSSLGFANLGAS
jgi:hypothetical protein